MVGQEGISFRIPIVFCAREMLETMGFPAGRQVQLLAQNLL
jgi:hypothetical protein